MDQILTDIQDILMEELGLDDRPAPEAKLADLDIDSLDRVSIAMAIEERFEIDIPDDDAEQFVTVDSIVIYVGKKLPQGYQLPPREN